MASDHANATRAQPYSPRRPRAARSRSRRRDSGHAVRRAAADSVSGSAAARHTRSICFAGGHVMTVIGWIVFGLVVGALAKLVMPGRDPGGIIVTMLLGIAGSMLGGLIGRAMGMYGPGQAAGFLMSFLGAVILLTLYRMMSRRRALRP